MATCQASLINKDPVSSLLHSEGIPVQSLATLDKKENGQRVFETKLDHFNSTITKTFDLRYWEDDSYFDKHNSTNPIFLYVCGEWTCSQLTESTHTPFVLGKRLNALHLNLEHRYYGDS